MFNLAGRKKGSGSSMSTVSMNQVREVIGEEAADKMIDAFGGKHLYIWKNNRKVSIEDRNKIIKNLYQEGRSPAWIAKEVDLSIDHVKTIIYKR